MALNREDATILVVDTGLRPNIKLSSLRNWYQHSRLRTWVIEMCSWYRRTLILLRSEHHYRGWLIPMQVGCRCSAGRRDAEASSPLDGLRDTFPAACSAGIQKLRDLNPWMNVLDAEVAAEAFRAGAAWAVDTLMEGRWDYGSDELIQQQDKGADMSNELLKTAVDALKGDFEVMKEKGVCQR